MTTQDLWQDGPVKASPEDSVRREMRLGAMIGGAFFVGLLGWAAVTPLDAGANAQGIVAVSGNRQAVQHRDGGIVTALHVSEGQTVAKGDPLLQISASELIATERALTGEVTTLLATRARLVAERDGAAAITTPVEFATYAPTDRPMAEEAIQSQRQLFQARRNALQTERGVLGQRIEQHGQQINGYGQQMRSNEEQQRLIGEELDGLKTLLPRGFVSINRIRAMERTAAELSGGHGAYRADMARTSAAIGEARMQIASIEKQRIEEVSTQLGEVQMRLDEIQPRLAATREQLARSVVRAPESGRVVGLNVFTVGGVVAAGETVMEVLPQDRDLVVEARVSPTDADDLKPDMETQLRFTALQERNLPILKGRISRVSADSFEDTRTGGRYFQIEIVVPPEEMAKLRAVRDDGGVRAGLPVDVMIPLRKRTAFEYLMEPLTQTLWLAGREN